MKPSQLSLFPTAQADTWKYSDEDACYNCNNRVYDMEKNAEVCEQARQLLHEVDMYIICRETPQQITKVRHKACDLLNTAIELRNQSRNL